MQREEALITFSKKEEGEETEKRVMTMARSAWSGVATVAFLVFFLSCVKAEEESVEVEVDHIVSLDFTNFTDYVFKQDFIVVEFYAPWCGACKGFEPEYKKAAQELSSHDPPIILAKIDASAEENSAIRDEYDIQGFPTIKTFRKQGKYIENYREKRSADGMIPYLKKLVGPPSLEIKSAEDAATLIDDKRVSIVGLFPEFSGEEFDNFTILAQKMRTQFDFGHTSDAKILPRRERFNKPTLRVFRPFDDLFVDFQNFDIDAMRNFIKESSLPILPLFDGDELNEKYVDKFFGNNKAKVMLFVNFSQEYDAFKPKFYDLAKSYNDKGLGFLLGDTNVGETAFEYFALKQDQAPLVLIYAEDATKYLITNVVPNDIAPWLKDYKDGKLKPYIRSQPIPEVNDEPVKVVVRETLQKLVLESEKEVLLNLYESVGCALCKRLATALDEIAVELENDTDILIAKLDANANDIPADIFDVQEFPALYFKTASGKIIPYEGGKYIKKENAVEFIQKNRETPEKADLIKKDLENPEAHKDEL